MAAKHAVVRTDKMFGTDNRAGQVSFEFMGSNGKTPTAIDNGNIVKIEKLKEGKREVMVAKQMAGDEKTVEGLALVATPETWYDREHNLDEFENEVGAICRGYMLHHNDIFAATAEAFATTPEVGQVVEATAGTKLTTTSAPGAKALGTVIAIDKVGRYTYYVVEVK